SPVGQFLHRDVADEETQHPLAILRLSRRSPPEARKVTCQREHLCLLCLRGYARFLALKLGGFGRNLFDAKQRLVPAALEGSGNQPIGWIAFLIASFGERSLVLGAFDAHLPLAHDCLVALFKFFESR